MARSLYFILLVAVVLIVTAGQWLDKVTPEERKKAIEYANKCKRKQSVDETYLTALRLGKWKETKNDDNCFILCYISQNNKIYDREKGEITEYYVDTFVQKTFGDDIAKKVKDNCDKTRFFGKFNCLRAFEAFKCFNELGATVL